MTNAEIQALIDNIDEHHHAERDDYDNKWNAGETLTDADMRHIYELQSEVVESERAQLHKLTDRAWLLDLADEIVVAYDNYLKAIQIGEDIQGTAAELRIAIDRYRNEKEQSR